MDVADVLELELELPPLTLVETAVVVDPPATGGLSEVAWAS